MGTYVIVFSWYAAHGQKNGVRWICGVALGGCTLWIPLHIAFSANPAATSRLFGWIALITNLALFIVPCGQLTEVIRTGIIEVFPLPLAVVSTFSNLVWAYYGYLRANPLFEFCCIFGFIFNGTQAAVVIYIYLTYGRELLKECELDKQEDLRSSRMPFYRNQTRRIDLREADLLMTGLVSRCKNKTCVGIKQGDIGSNTIIRGVGNRIPHTHQERKPLVLDSINKPLYAGEDLEHVGFPKEPPITSNQNKIGARADNVSDIGTLEDRGQTRHMPSCIHERGHVTRERTCHQDMSSELNTSGTCHQDTREVSLLRASLKESVRSRGLRPGVILVKGSQDVKRVATSNGERSNRVHTGGGAYSSGPDFDTDFEEDSSCGEEGERQERSHAVVVINVC